MRRAARLVQAMLGDFAVLACREVTGKDLFLASVGANTPKEETREDLLVAGVDLGFSINNDDELDALEIAGGWNAAFDTRDLANTATNYSPQDAGGQIVMGDPFSTIDGLTFAFDGTNSGVVLGVGKVELRDVTISGATAGVLGDGLTELVTLTRATIQNNSGSGVQLTNQSGELSVSESSFTGNGNHGFDFQGSGGSVAVARASSANSAS